MMIHMELKNRIVIVNEKNMEALSSLYGICSIDELERIVNSMIDNAVKEIREDEGRGCIRLHREKLQSERDESADKINCNNCEFSRTYDYGRRTVYCDNEDREDDIGKLGINELSNRSPKWCPLRCKGNGYWTTAAG